VLKRVESEAFFGSSLKSIVIPRTVASLDASAILRCDGISVSIEEGSEHFVVDGDFLLSFDLTVLVRYLGRDRSIDVSARVEILGSSCFAFCGSLSSISFESGCMLKRIESHAFYSSSLKLIKIPWMVEILGSACFCHSRSLASISFESGCQLKRIESDALSGTGLALVCLPGTVQWIGANAFPDSCDVSQAAGALI
jgi:hypothetical protein